MKIKEFLSICLWLNLLEPNIKNLAMVMNSFGKRNEFHEANGKAQQSHSKCLGFFFPFKFGRGRGEKDFYLFIYFYFFPGSQCVSPMFPLSS
jgi:hypothetical protein